jgi:hypothetical protein
VAGIMNNLSGIFAVAYVPAGTLGTRTKKKKEKNK